MNEDLVDTWPQVNQLWPPEGDNMVTNMDVVFFSDLEGFDLEGAAQESFLKPGETWLQKGHPEVCWPQQWLPEDLGSNVRIFEMQPIYFPRSTVVSGESDKTTALQQLEFVARESIRWLHWYNFPQHIDGQGRPLVFVGHGYGGLVLKQALVEFHCQPDKSKELRNNLCGIVFYGGTNTKLTNKHGPMLMENKGRSLKDLTSLKFETVMSESVEDLLLDDTLSELSEHFGAALDLKKVKVCVVIKNKSFFQEIKDYSDLERQLTDVMDSNDISTPTSKDDPSYLEWQLTDVMDSNDIYTPTSKEDPSYLTVLEFLRQFLPKGLYQTIDDKKGQEVQLRSSETKDKAALGDMEIASTSTRENRDKEMDEKQCVVQHVDQGRDMLTEEAHKLQTFLCQKIEMAQRHGSSTIFPNLHELHSKFLEDTSIFVGARKNVEKDSIEFLFLDAQCMSKVVGVGLHQALVTVTNDNDVKVEAQSESDWESGLASMFMKDQTSGGFELIGFKMPKMEKDNNKTRSLQSPKQDSKQFGVGLKDRNGTMNQKEESKMFFPVILKVAEVYNALKDGDPHVTKQASGVGSSTGASSASGASSSGNNQQGKEEGKSLQTWSLWKPWTGWGYGKGDENNDEGKPPGGDPTPYSGPSSDPEMVPPKYTVNVYPKKGCAFRVGRQNPDEIKTASSINPNLEIVFFRNKTGAKFLDVTTRTQCSLGSHAHRRDFRWFHNDIKISFEGISSECERTTLKNPSVTTENDEEPMAIREETHTNFGGATNVADQKGKSIRGSAMFAGFGVQAEGSQNRTETNEGSYSMTDIEETTGVKQIGGFNINPMHLMENLTFLFDIPTRIMKSDNLSRLKQYRNTFTPKIVGHWDVPKHIEIECANYSFNVERQLFHIKESAVTFEGGCWKDYELQLFINLAMTHLVGLPSDTTIEVYEENYDGPAIQLFPVQ